MKRLTTLLALMGSVAVLAQAPPPPDEIMKQNDKNKDGQITIDELKAMGGPTPG
jgi:EF hand